MDSYSEYEISPNRIPIEIIWDYKDSRIFAISTEYAKDLNAEEEKQNIENITNSENEEDEEEEGKSKVGKNSDWTGGEVYSYSTQVKPV